MKSTVPAQMIRFHFLVCMEGYTMYIQPPRPLTHTCTLDSDQCLWPLIDYFQPLNAQFHPSLQL